jgi:hypothetical protein
MFYNDAQAAGFRIDVTAQGVRKRKRVRKDQEAGLGV